MDPAAVDARCEELDAFCAEAFASIPHHGTHAWGDCYLRGLVLDGRRRSTSRWPIACPTAACCCAPILCRLWTRTPFAHIMCHSKPYQKFGEIHTDLT
ncbi:hypothetical protein GCM10023224_14140 [Streptomonospora halophila]|uniref:Uncharacterized protein n=1 Tax=Streptomonospora halophila TaxID=427369 RepID=A0ABP9GDN2_9ACTN